MMLSEEAKLSTTASSGDSYSVQPEPLMTISPDIDDKGSSSQPQNRITIAAKNKMKLVGCVLLFRLH